MEAVTTKRRKSRKKTSVADKVFVTLNTLFMIMFVIITLYPVLNTLAINARIALANSASAVPMTVLATVM